MAYALITLRYVILNARADTHKGGSEECSLYFIAISYYNSVIDTKIHLYTFVYQVFTNTAHKYSIDVTLKSKDPWFSLSNHSNSITKIVYKMYLSTQLVRTTTTFLRNIFTFPMKY